MSTLILIQKVIRGKVPDMNKEAVKVLMSVPDVLTHTGQGGLILLVILYCTSTRIDKILSIKINQLHLKVDKLYITVIVIVF